ncbi:hypothetical protein [Cellulosimicrobium arenosum]|uniref:Serine kinase n=1 Tax=Cellulosimicrobium arenosum TaxID=2708133 RepID=A0A927IZX2_9MICO|nr:hypothetical protein [Cellulosimicrobium arenosum]MBD8078937.1 hypothetical protein [Cellulosimicrobium arenosum]
MTHRVGVGEAGWEHVRLYGLHVVSELPLHQDRPADPAEPVDVTVRWGDEIVDASEPADARTLLDYADGDRAFYTFFERASGDYLLRFHRTCDVHVSADLATVHVHLRAGADPGVAAILVTGAVLSFQLYLRGVAVLHGSAVDIGGRAVAFVGASGMGKSTMATLLCAAGGSVITDDVLRVDLDGTPSVRLGASELRLRKGADELVGRFEGEDPAVRTSADARQVLRLGAGADDALPLAAIVVPWPDREHAELDVERIEPTVAVFALITYARLLGWKDKTVVDRHFAQVAQIARSVPVYRARVPWGPPFAPDLAERLLAELDV